MKEYFEKLQALRHDPMVKAWIAAEQKAEGQWANKKNCHHCGFPHSKNLLCNGAPFGRVRIGSNSYAIHTGNLVYMYDFMSNLGRDFGFHWRDERFFKRVGDHIEIRFFDQYNNVPQERIWKIPVNEWASIVKSVEAKPMTPTTPSTAQVRHNVSLK